ncbi:MAG TPA: hypothetical protein VE727_01695 [Solirubrobacterales bacterium]|jgi:hypothetical protein|nr:hypothetical protein [Solirubrobacterales bacterium]
MERRTTERKREPSPLAAQLADAFAPCAHWSEVRVQRGTGGRRTRVILGSQLPAAAPAPSSPFDWAAGGL